MGRRNIPEVNAGSMADIAFLLLIFFLVTTTFQEDAGINRKLPPMPPPGVTPPIIKQKNLFTVLVNKNNDLLVEEEIMDIKDLRKAAIEFLDNGGGTNEKGEPCTYCKGKKDPESSDHPNKAIISVRNDRETNYKTFMSVQNELVGAYNVLRNREAQRLYQRDFTEMESVVADPQVDESVKEDLKEKMEVIKELFPLKISEAETNN
ncbi:biopolymer transport protein ExbD [Kordia periserrulae]|uniref:Biopolymer transport protein ExbD n=1 Tax=Kordia periserrulae TaxID=701523 RepID=A0A2T6C6H5_9FLAO|nr:biopolymer transporter ExbD [Kordia periserrulae]PTX63928.1 biopolymer transport protein ExbD [Kordia periserrulae]